MASAIPEPRQDSHLRDAGRSAIVHGSRRGCRVLSLAMYPRALLVVLLVGCGSHSADHPDAGTGDAPPENAYTVGGKVIGLHDGATVVLANNGGDQLTITVDGAFTFATPLASGANYDVTVATQPERERCVVANGSGTI